MQVKEAAAEFLSRTALTDIMFNLLFTFDGLPTGLAGAFFVNFFWCHCRTRRLLTLYPSARMRLADDKPPAHTASSSKETSDLGWLSQVSRNFPRDGSNVRQQQSEYAWLSLSLTLWAVPGTFWLIFCNTAQARSATSSGDVQQFWIISVMALTLSALARFPKVSQVELRLFLVDELAGLSSGKSSLGSGVLAAGFFGNGTAGRGAVGGELAGAAGCEALSGSWG